MNMVIDNARVKIRGEGFDYDNYQNHLFVGTTRSGKTTAMLHVIERSIKRGEPVFIISGKNGAKDPYSMYSQVKALCGKYGKMLYIFSTDASVDNAYIYNPFKYTEINGVSNTMTLMARYSDTHYESNFEFWIICICEILKMAGKELSLPNIMKLFTWESFSSMVKHMQTEGRLTKENAEEYLSYEDIADTASASRPRFLKYLRGDGKKILIGDKRSISVQDVRDKDAVFMLDLDGLMYEDFSCALGTMAISDIRSMISNETDFEKKKLIVFDELSVFFSPLLPNIYSQASGFGYQSLAGSQSFSDMDKVSPDLAERIIENSHVFGFLLQNSAKDAERAAEIIGTKKDTEITRRKDGVIFDKVGSEKVIESFKVHPNEIKELNPLEMIYYNKTAKDKAPIKIKWHFLNI